MSRSGCAVRRATFSTSSGSSSVECRTHYSVHHACNVTRSDAATQPALLRRVVAEYRRAEPHQLQHALRLQDPDDHLPRHRSRRRHAVALGHLQLDPARLRRVRDRSAPPTSQRSIVMSVSVCLSV